MLTEYQGKIYVSSRSIDEINVQLIMERLGGGGHLNVAGAQLTNCSLQQAKHIIQDTIDEMFGYTIHNGKGKPTNSEFIALITDRIRLEYKMY